MSSLSPLVRWFDDFKTPPRALFYLVLVKRSTKCIAGFLPKNSGFLPKIAPQTLRMTQFDSSVPEDRKAAHDPLTQIKTIE